MNREQRLMAVLFHICHFVGVLPLEWNTHINYRLHLCGQDKGCFSTSARGRLVTFAQLFLVFYFSGGFNKPFQEHVISIYSIVSTIGFTSSLSALLLILFYQPNKLAQCCSSVCKVRTLPSTLNKRFPFHLFLILSIYPFVTEIYFFFFTTALGIPFKQFLNIVTANYHHTPAVCIEVVFTVLCFIMARAFGEINNQMKTIRTFNTKTFGFLVGLLKNFNLVSNCVRCVAEYFGPHFVIIFTVYVLRMIFFSIILVRMSKHIMMTITYGIYTFYHTARLIFICKWSEKVKVESLEAIRTLRRIRELWVGQLSQDQANLLDGYEEWLNSSEIEFTACGLFPINTHQILDVLESVVTYSMVAIQAK